MEAAVLLHVVDVSDPKAAAQSEAVYQVLKEIDADNIPMLTVWNKVDATADPAAVMTVAASRKATVCLSAATGLGIDDLLLELEDIVEGMMVPMKLLVPYSKGELLGELYKKWVVNREEFREKGTFVLASVPGAMVGRCKALLTDEEFSSHDEEEEEHSQICTYTYLPMLNKEHRYILACLK